MGEIKDNLRSWAQTTLEADLYQWENLHDIPLYMDQVLTFLSGSLNRYQRDANEKTLTSSMVNNYVKGEVISHPVQKKYSREQVASIFVVAMLKSVLSMQDLRTLLSDCPDTEEFYRQFSDTQGNAMADVSAQMKCALENGENLKLLALRFSAEANARRTAAERILLEIDKETRPLRPKILKVKK